VRVNWVAYNTVELKDGELYSRVAPARYRVIQRTYSPAVVAGAWEAVLECPRKAETQLTSCSGN
jgi:hypothetical protein